MTASESLKVGVEQPGLLPVVDSTPLEVEIACLEATNAFPWIAGLSRAERCRLLGAIADNLENHSHRIISLADEETGLGAPRLRSELTRTTSQLRFLGAVAVEGSYLSVSIEHAAESPAGSHPDLRKTSIPIGPVAIFGASNFPLAFGVAGGDTASALAAGCSVILKAHPSHVQTCILIGSLIERAMNDMGAPAGVFSMVFGQEAGVALVKDRRVRAVGFTGSLHGGRALLDVAAARPDPIPFYGELGSVNPLVVTRDALAGETKGLAAGIASSMTMGVGQFCTKPGLLLVPNSSNGDKLVEDIAEELRDIPSGRMLNNGIRDAFRRSVSSIKLLEGVETIYESPIRQAEEVGPVLVRVDAATLSSDSVGALLEECFGPFAVVVTYGSDSDLSAVLRLLPPALTGTVLSAGPLDADLQSIGLELQQRSGRVIFDDFPTGVSVAWGMQHGGQYPASTSQATSVGADSIKRWIRPITFQGAPASFLPDDLKDEGPTPPIPRRIDGELIA